MLSLNYKNYQNPEKLLELVRVQQGYWIEDQTAKISNIYHASNNQLVKVIKSKYCK